MPTNPQCDTVRSDEPEISDHIHPWIALAFEALMSNSGSYGLMPCEVAGEPSAAIVMGRETEQGVEVMPLFVALTPSLKIRMPRRRRSSGGGPNRDEVARAFAANVASLSRS